MNVILIGFMGSGKSSVASKLAERLKYSLVETDVVVLAQSGRKSINEIFSLDGELRFREMEIEVAKKLSSKQNVVISTGGGMVINKVCIDYLKQNGVIIFLEASFGAIVKRLESDNTRPLFKNKDRAQKLFHFRKGLYEEYADITIKTDTLSIDEVTNSILKKI